MAQWKLKTESVNMLQHLPISKDGLNEICSLTKEDKMLQILFKAMCHLWPNDKTKVPSEIRAYFSSEAELSCPEVIVFRHERTVFTDSQRRDIPHHLHSSHLGMQGCLQRA